MKIIILDFILYLFEYFIDHNLINKLIGIFDNTQNSHFYSSTTKHQHSINGGAQLNKLL